MRWRLGSGRQIPVDLLSKELRAAESDVDSYHLNNALSRRPWAQAGWYFLAFCDEIMLHSTAQDAGTRQDYAAIADNLVVHAKWPLRWLNRACPRGGKIPRKFDDEMYEAAWHLSELSMEYLSFESAFVYASSGLLTLALEGNSIKPSGEMASDTRFDAYDRLVQNPDMPTVQPAAQSFFDRVSASVRVRGEWFDYDLNPQIVQTGVDAIGPFIDAEFALPADWRFSRFTLAQFADVARVLWVLAMIHFHARTAAATLGCKGLGFARALILWRGVRLSAAFDATVALVRMLWLQ